MKKLASIFGLLGLIGAAFAVPAHADSLNINPQTGTTYTFKNTDCSKLVTFSNASAVAATLPQASSASGGGSGSGQFMPPCVISVTNNGFGTVTVTPTTSTIGGATSWAIPTGQSLDIVSDGVNYQVKPGSAAYSAAATNFRNLLDNGAMTVQQRGTGTQTCGTTTIPASAYSADRWGCNVNVTSGAGTLQVSTSSPPAPYTATELFYRTSGALLQPQCVMQEIPTSISTQVAGQTVTLSFTAKALANMITDNGGVMNAYIFTGTGTDQGLQSFTASPAITPAWTGISSTLTKAITLTSSYARYSYTASLPSSETELAVALCWTPTSATGAGSTDGFQFTGVQLEVAPFATAYEFHNPQADLNIAQAYYVQWADNLANTFTLPGTCVETTANTSMACQMILPRTMRTTPTVAVATATSFGITKVADGTALACTTLAIVSSSGNPNSIKLTCAASETAAVGTNHIMLYANTGASNTITVSADF